MAKKKKKQSNASLLSIVAAVLGFITLAVLFLPAIGIKDTETTYTGAQIAFGYKKSSFGVEVDVFNFSFMNLLPFILAVAGLVFAIYAGLKGSKLFALLAGLIFIAEGVFLLLGVANCVPAGRVEAVVEAFRDTCVLAWGSIVGAIIAFIAGAASVFSVVAK